MSCEGCFYATGGTFNEMPGCLMEDGKCIEDEVVEEVEDIEPVGDDHPFEQDQIYKERGFETRDAYLLDLAEQYGVDPQIVFGLASVLGREEDFDGLVSELEDVGCMEDYF